MHDTEAGRAAWQQALDYLKTEEALLLAADIPGLIRQQEHRAQAFAALAIDRLDPQRLQDLRLSAERNRRLAAAIHDGVSDAREKVAFLLAPKPFKAYGPDGLRHDLGGR